MGVVHLKGFVDGGPNNTIFTLPAGYRPIRNVVEIIHRGTSGFGSLIIRPEGTLGPLSGTGNASLDGVTFRAGA